MSEYLKNPFDDDHERSQPTPPAPTPVTPSSIRHSAPVQRDTQPLTPGSYKAHLDQAAAVGSGKSRGLAAVLALFLGWFGVHNFYFGYKGKGFIQLALFVAFLALPESDPMSLVVLFLFFWLVLDFFRLVFGIGKYRN